MSKAVCVKRTVLTDTMGFNRIFNHLGKEHRVFNSFEFFRYKDVVGVTLAGKNCPFDFRGKCIVQTVRPEGCK